MFSMQPPNNGMSLRTCQRCGKPLSPNEVYCDNCGVFNGLPPANSFNRWTPPLAAPVSPSMSAPGGQTTYGTGQQWEQSPAMPASNNVNGGYSSPQQPFRPNNYYSAAPQASQSFGTNNYYGTLQQEYSPSLPPITGDLQPGSMNGFPSGFEHMPQPRVQKGNRKLGLIIGASILIIVLIGGAFLGYTFLLNKNGKTLSTSSSTAPSPTPTPSGKLLFSDSFNNNNNGWDLTSDPGQLSVQVGGGKMVLEDDNNKLLWEVVPGKTFSDFNLTVDAVLSKGDQNNGYGIYIRGGTSRDSQLGTYYRFELYGDGTYAIFKGVLDSNGDTQSVKLVGYSASASIQKQGIVNHVSIIAKGQTMTFMVNGQILSKITDNNYKGGSAALFVSNLPGSPPGAQATFSHLAIYQD